MNGSKTDSCKFPTQEIMGTPNFNSVPKFFQNGHFRPPNLAFLDRKKFSDNLPAA